MEPITIRVEGNRFVVEKHYGNSGVVAALGSFNCLRDLLVGLAQIVQQEIADRAVCDLIASGQI